MRISDWSSTCALPICTREEDKPVVRCQRFELVACRLEGDAGAFRKLFGDRDVEARGRVQPRSDRGAALRQLADIVGQRGLDPRAARVKLLDIARKFLTERQRCRILQMGDRKSTRLNSSH